MQPILRLLGRFELVSGSDEALTIPGARAQLLLARLALPGGHRMDRGVLSTMLWGERADAQARASLRQLIWTIRQAMKSFPDALVAQGDSVSLDLQSFDIDVVQFEKLARSTDLGELEAALALYRGDLLEGIDVLSLAPDGYFLQERNRLRDLALQVAGKLVDGHGRQQHWEDVVRACRRGLNIEPFDEALHPRLVDALQKLGRHREAQGQDEAFRSRLMSELGVASAPHVAQGAGQRLANPPLAATAPQPAPIAPTVHTTTSPRPRVWLAALAAAVVVAILALGPGFWRDDARQSAALQEVPPVASNTDRIPTRNLQAYDQYLRAEAERLTAFSDDQLRAVLTAFRAAITLDPDFAAAHAGFALVAVELWQRSLDGPFPSLSARSEAYDAAGRALQIDPGNARALIVLSRIQAQDGARVVALASARRAVASEPASAEARANLALTLSYAGHTTEARAQLTQLQRLDPIPRPEWYLIFGQVAFADGRYDAAIADFAAVWPTLAQNALLLEHLAAALALQGRLRQANQITDRLVSLMPNANLRLTKQRYALLRDRKQNERLLEGLRRAGLPEWPYRFIPNEKLRLTGRDLAALTQGAQWTGQLGNGSTFRLESDAEGGFTFHADNVQVSGRQFLRDDELCQVTPVRPAAGETCGSVYRNPDGQNPESKFVFVSADDVRYFSIKE